MANLKQITNSSSDSELQTPLAIRLTPLLAIIVSLSFSVTLLCLNLTGWSSDSHLRNIYYSDHSLVSPFIQILSTIFAYFQLYATFRTFEFWTRVKITTKTASLTQLRFWLAALHRNFDISLPVLYALLVAVIIGAAAIPASLWAGSLALQPSTAQFNDSTILAPIPGIYVSAMFNSWVTKNTLGTFTHNVAQIFSSNVLLDASKATSNPIIINRFDNTQMIYNGRSYGVGSSVGLKDQHLSVLSNSGQNYLQGYSYHEIGFETNVSCRYNTSSTWMLKPIASEVTFTDRPGYVPATFSAQYSNPAANDQNYGVSGYNDHRNIVAWSSAPPSVPGFIDMTAGSNYAALNNISCTVTFIPTVFLVTVDKTLLTINVTVVEPYTDGELDQNEILRSMTMQELHYISLNDQLPVASTLGDALYSAGTDLDSIAAAFSVMVDAILLSTASAQTQYPGFDTNATLSQNLDIQRTITVIRFGNPKITIALVALNAFILITVIGSMLFSKAWSELPKFNYLEVASLILAARHGAEVEAGLSRTSDAHCDPETEIGVKWKRVGKEGGSTAWVLQLSPGGKAYAPLETSNEELETDCCA